MSVKKVSSGKFEVRVWSRKENRSIYIGRFNTLEEAVKNDERVYQEINGRINYRQAEDFCKNGHKLVARNYKIVNGKKVCLECRRKTQKRYWRNLKKRRKENE